MIKNTAGTKVLPDGTVELIIPICPRTKKNHQNIYHKNIVSKKTGVTKRVPFVSTSTQYKSYAKDSALFIRPLGIDYPVNVKAIFYVDTYRLVDLTNLNEALHDIMVSNGMLKDDNAKIVVSTDGSRVFYDKNNPRTEVYITRTEPTFIK
jgi:Holliday junction resolvase RusA-like endonuclease